MSGRPIDPAAHSPTPVVDWPMIGRVVLKAVILFVLLNAVFAALRPMEALGNVSLYNVAFPGRARLPYGEVPADDYNLTLNNVPAMLASHALNRPERGGYTVLILGDSGTWGWFLENEATLAGQLNDLELHAAAGGQVVAYNLGYPVMSLTKDVLLLDAALERIQPDMIIWLVTMQSFARDRQLEHPLLQQNAGRVRRLIADYNLALDASDPRLVDRDFLDETPVARRRDLADLLRLQAWGLAWAATGHDQAIPAVIPPRQSDLEADESWLDVAAPRTLTGVDLTFDVLAGGIARAGGSTMSDMPGSSSPGGMSVPVLVVNEPIYISDGANSDVRYNSFYPRWAYDQYRTLLAGVAGVEGWRYLDLWDAIPPEEFTDTPVHLTPDGMQQLAYIIARELALTR